MSKYRELDEAISTGYCIAFKDGELLTPERATAIGGWLGLWGDGAYISERELKVNPDPVDALVRRLMYDKNGQRLQDLHPVTAGLVVPGFIRALGPELGMKFLTRLQGQFPDSRIVDRIIKAQELLAQGNWGLLD